MSPIARAARQTFKALRVRNYRLYFFGQVISASGTWMHAVALGLLVLSDQLHGNGFNVGIVTALQFLPMLLLGSWGGLIVDRVDKRRLLYVTQTASGFLALALGLLVALGTVTMWEVYLISTLFGVVNLFDNPARQTFVSEMVGRDLMPNAISLNSVVMNSARVIGPAIGGILIFTVGLAACFLFNAASYVAVLVALFMMRPAELHQRPMVVRAKGQVREGLRYVWSTRELRDPLLAMAVVGIFAFNFTTTLPLLATRTFHGGAGTYSALMSAMGAGAVVGGLMVAHRSRPSTTMLSLIGLAFGVMLLVVAAAPTEVVALVALVFMGICSISFISTANATIQMQADRPCAVGSWPSTPSPSLGAPPSVPAGGLDRRRHQPAGRHHGRRRGDPGRLHPPRPALPADGRCPRSTLAVTSEIPDAEPGEVVDFAPRPIIDAASEEDQAQIRRVAGTCRRQKTSAQPPSGGTFRPEWSDPMDHARLGRAGGDRTHDPRIMSPLL